jgi:hypothetical protein
MAKNVVPFSGRPEPERSRPTGQQHSRFLVTIGPMRYAFEFSSSVMEVNTADAQVMPIEEGDGRQARVQRVKRKKV